MRSSLWGEERVRVWDDSIFNLQDGGVIYGTTEHGRRSRVVLVVGVKEMLISFLDLESLSFRW